jgi:UDP-glucose 4-epimerase
MTELLAEEFHRIYGLPTTAVRIFSAYGPGLRRQVVWDICRRALTNDRLLMHGTGEESRDFIHAADVAAALALLVERAPFEGDRYNVATGCETTIRLLADLVIEELGRSMVPEYDGTATPGDPRNWRADISRITALGFAPRISLREGLRGVAGWAKAELSAAA